jgi:L-malate glycosyltransferase
LKRILIITPEFPPLQWGGLARTVSKVAEISVSFGIETEIAHLEVEANRMVLLDENRITETKGDLIVHRIKVGRELFSGPREIWDCPHTLTFQMMYQSLEQLLNNVRFDLLHSFFLYPMGFITGLLAKRFGIPNICTVVGNDIKKYIFSPEKTAFCKIGLNNADKIVGLSQDLIEMADSLTPIKTKSEIIYNSVDIPRLGEKKPNQSFKIGCAGIFKYAKGLPYLLKALESVSKEYRIECELLGTIRESERPVLEEILNRTGMQEKINIRDAVPNKQIYDWLNTLDAFVLPSLTEGCPNILMEAMASGVPCVATKTGANELLLEGGRAGLLVPWGDSNAISNALKKLIEFPELARELATSARLRMAEFSSQRERDSWKKVYREFMDI